MELGTLAHKRSGGKKMFAPYKHGIEVSHDIGFKRLVDSTRFTPNSPGPAASELREGTFAILGYPDDRGVERNNGRAGACEGPDSIRSVLYRMTPSPLKVRDLQILDLGNMRSWSMDLLEAHQEARKAISQLRSSKAKLVTLGGGHDWAYSDFIDWQGPLLHLDAHLDMRPNPEDTLKHGHSGTPFRRILSESKHPPQIKAIGLQSHCNSRSHLDWSGGFSVSTLFIEELPLAPEKQWELMLDQLELDSDKNKKSPFVMSIDMDVFSQSVAPGVSAPQPYGLDPALVLRLIRHLGPRLQQLGVYETNPRFDLDRTTARLAAKFVHEFFTHG
jgi:formiminoglutamase